MYEIKIGRECCRARPALCEYSEFNKLAQKVHSFQGYLDHLRARKTLPDRSARLVLSSEQSFEAQLKPGVKHCERHETSLTSRCIQPSARYVRFNGLIMGTLFLTATQVLKRREPRHCFGHSVVYIAQNAIVGNVKHSSQLMEALVYILHRRLTLGKITKAAYLYDTDV